MSTQTPSRNVAQQQAPAGSPAIRGEMQSRNMSNVPNPSTQSTYRSDVRGDSAAHQETKPAWMTSEFYIFLATVGGILLASELVGRNAAGVDVFRANTAWFLITLVAIAYVVSRGLAKAGSSWRHANRNR